MLILHENWHQDVLLITVEYKQAYYSRVFNNKRKLAMTKVHSTKISRFSCSARFQFQWVAFILFSLPFKFNVVFSPLQNFSFISLLLFWFKWIYGWCKVKIKSMTEEAWISIEDFSFWFESIKIDGKSQFAKCLITLVLLHTNKGN